MGKTVQQLREGIGEKWPGINMKDMRSIGKTVVANSLRPVVQCILCSSNGDNLIIQECQQIFIIRGYRLRSDLQLQLLHISLPLELLESVHD